MTKSVLFFGGRTTLLAAAASVLAKAQVAAYTRKDGTQVQAHDDGRQAAAPKPAGGGYVAPKEGDVGHEEHTKYGKYFRPGDSAKDGSGKTHKVLKHVGPEVVTENGDRFHPSKLDHLSSAAKAAPQAAAHADGSGFGPHKKGDYVSYKGVRGSMRTGKVKGVRDGKVIVEHKAGYTEDKHHTELSAHTPATKW